MYGSVAHSELFTRVKAKYRDPQILEELIKKCRTENMAIFDSPGLFKRIVNEVLDMLETETKTCVDKVCGIMDYMIEAVLVGHIEVKLQKMAADIQVNDWLEIGEEVQDGWHWGGDDGIGWCHCLEGLVMIWGLEIGEEMQDGWHWVETMGYVYVRTGDMGTGDSGGRADGLHMIILTMFVIYSVNLFLQLCMV